MHAQRRPLQPGEPAPGFSLPSANSQGLVSADNLRGQPFLIGFYRGLHCPFCRRQLLLLARVQPALLALGIETVAVINTPVDHARLYFRHRPTPVVLLCDPYCHVHESYGVPHVEFLPAGSGERPEWPWRTSPAEFEAARINPHGMLPEPMHPMQANTVLNARDGFELQAVDRAIFERHGTQLVGHFLVDARGIVRWARVEAPDTPNSLCDLPDAGQLLSAAERLAH